jgi:hypothetical protein
VIIGCKAILEPGWLGRVGPKELGRDRASGRVCLSLLLVQYETGCVWLHACIKILDVRHMGPCIMDELSHRAP